jgi:type IV pilus assembly protein PilB
MPRDASRDGVIRHGLALKSGLRPPDLLQVTQQLLGPEGESHHAVLGAASDSDGGLLDAVRAPAARPRLGDVLVDAGVVTDDELTAALDAQRSVIGARRRIGHVLVDLGLASERQIAVAVAEQLDLRVVDLTTVAISPETVRLLPRSVALRLGMVVLSRTGNQLTLAVVDPTDVVALDDVRLHTGATELVVTVTTESQVRQHLIRVWSLSEDSSDVGSFFDESDPAFHLDEDPYAAAADAPTVRLVSLVLADAVRATASDIHVEPQRDVLRIRYRIDGVLREVMSVPRSAYASVVSRLKIVSGLDIAERRLPQDGRTRIAVDGVKVDARVSTMPSVHGEKVVVRLLSRAEQLQPLDEVGLDADQLATLRSALLAPQGLVLITGPTGSGKTSTLYSALREIHTPGVNIVTLEDPVEVQIPGLTQVQVHERSGLTFSRGLRAVMRQDPDVVLVGEVRDRETAELAVRASLTGHLVLTTLHTTNAVGSITRLVDMGLEPYLAGSALTAVVAQRLVRRVCPACAVTDEPDGELLGSLGISRAMLRHGSPRRGTGCAECGRTGYRGRTGVFQVLPVDSALRRVLMRTPDEQVIADAVADRPTIKDAAVAKALSGETTFDEVLRVSPRD